MKNCHRIFTVIVQFRVRYDRWIKEVKTHFYRLSFHLKKYIHKFQREKDLFITLSIVYIQISNTYLPEFVNILLYIEANPVLGPVYMEWGPRSSGVGFFCFHALGDTKQKKPTQLDRGPPLHVNRVLMCRWCLYSAVIFNSKLGYCMSQ